MGRAETVRIRVSQGLRAPLRHRDGRVVPEAADIGQDEAVKLDATYVYADMARSSKLAHTVYPEVAARIIRAYVNTATQLLNMWDGEIRSFDGDRVMGIFVGENHNRAATRAALAVNWAVHEVIWPAIQERWNDTESWGWALEHGVGIDTGEALLIRTGVRGDNDIASIGSAPNVAAKLSELRGLASIYITRAVYEDLNDSLWYGPKRESMWSKRYSLENVGDSSYEVWESNWSWDP